MTTKTLERTLDLVPLSKFAEYYDYPTVPALRQLHFDNPYGFKEKVVKKVGKRLYIKISALKEWIDETNNNQVA